MTNERFFRMLSVAVLGLIALAVVPDSKATDAQATVSQETSVLPAEITIVREINEINAGRFNPATLAEPDDALLAVDQLEATTISQIDPNL